MIEVKITTEHGITEKAVLSHWYFSVGSKVVKAQPLAELETSKAVIIVPSPCNGIIKKINTALGQEVILNQSICTIEENES